jgi:hypothetical protein
MKILTKNKTFYIWLLSYLAVFLIPLVFSLFNYIYSIEIISYESLFHKKTTQNQMKDLVDLKLAEIDRITDQLIWDRQIRLYLKMDEARPEFRDSIEIKIKELRFLNKYIDQIYIINENKEISSGIISQETLTGIRFQKTKIIPFYMMMLTGRVRVGNFI